MEESKIIIENDNNANANKNRTNNKKTWLILIGVFLAVAMLSFFVTIIIDDEKTYDKAPVLQSSSMSVEYNEYLEDYTCHIKGVVANNTKRDYDFVKIEFSLFNASGYQIDTAFTTISSLNSGDSWQFDAAGLFLSERPTSYKLISIVAW